MSSIQNVAIVFAVAPVVLLLVFGNGAVLLRSTFWAAVCEAVAHGGFAFGSIIYLYFLVPRFKRTFEDFGVELPELTMAVISLSDVTVNYWWVFLFLILVALMFDLVIFVTMDRLPSKRYLARAFSALISLSMLAFANVFGYALFVQHSGMLQKLQ